jgi:hypothetical protein
MRLSFNRHRHALVAFSLPNFRVKDPLARAFGASVFAAPKETLNPGKRPNKEMTE